MLYPPLASLKRNSGNGVLNSFPSQIWVRCDEMKCNELHVTKKKGWIFKKVFFKLVGLSSE